MKILVVEDNERVAQFVCKGLREIGHAVDHAGTGRDGLFLATTERYDVMVLDRMLPGEIDGLGIIEALRRTGNKTPILILSALADVDDRIRGLRAGGDDYLPKPFGYAELAARLESLTRRRSGRTVETQLACGDLVMDLLTRRVQRADKRLELLPREFKLLEYLLRNKNRVLSRADIAINVWDVDFDTNTNVIDVYISYVRNKIDKQFAHKLIQTQVGMGYIHKEN